MIDFAPYSAKARAIRLPIPLPPPVIIAILSVKSNRSLSFMIITAVLNSDPIIEERELRNNRFVSFETMPAFSMPFHREPVGHPCCLKRGD
jgi:hypothetical protein